MLAAHLVDDGLDRLTILVPPASPPMNGVREDGEISSFIASGPWVSAFPQPQQENQSWCYQVVSRALASTSLPIIAITGGAPPPDILATARTIDVVLPHRGASSLLATCVTGLLRQTIPCKIALGLDQDCDDMQQEIIASSDRISAWAVHDPPHGPYVIRQHLAQHSTADFIAFQDSDDLSLPTRLAELTDAAIACDADIVGCHELRLDEIEGAVFAIRFPLDVTAALQVTASHPQFFPTTIVRTDYFTRHGGFSTDMRFGADTEFLLRSHFTARIRNIDRFLYIRRRRAGSLTTAPESALGTPARVALDRQWKADFAAIKDGSLDLHTSSLALRHAPSVALFRPI
jgi:hypothetical protein